MNLFDSNFKPNLSAFPFSFDAEFLYLYMYDMFISYGLRYIHLKYQSTHIKENLRSEKASPAFVVWFGGKMTRETLH